MSSVAISGISAENKVKIGLPAPPAPAAKTAALERGGLPKAAAPRGATLSGPRQTLAADADVTAQTTDARGVTSAAMVPAATDAVTPSTKLNTLLSSMFPDAAPASSAASSPTATATSPKTAEWKSDQTAKQEASQPAKVSQNGRLGRWFGLGGGTDRVATPTGKEQDAMPTSQPPPTPPARSPPAGLEFVQLKCVSTRLVDLGQMLPRQLR